MNALCPRVSERAAHRCEYCLAPENVFNFLHEVEHIIPLVRGGNDDEDNLALSCRACNIYKSDYVNGYDAETQSNARLFNPRLDAWGDHFSVDLETGVVTARTPIGRITIVRLHMNSSAQLVARRLWIELRLFP